MQSVLFVNMQGNVPCLRASPRLARSCLDSSVPTSAVRSLKGAASAVRTTHPRSQGRATAGVSGALEDVGPAAWRPLRGQKESIRVPSPKGF